MEVVSREEKLRLIKPKMEPASQTSGHDKVRPAEEAQPALPAFFFPLKLGLYRADATGRPLPNKAPPDTDDPARNRHPRQRILFMHPEERQRLAFSWREAVESGAEWSQEFRCLTEEGTVAWVQGSAVAVYDPQGKPTGYIGCNREISREKKANHDLKSSEERYRLALEATNDGLWDLEVGTDNCYFSQGCFRMLGYAGDEQSAGMDWLSIVHPSDMARGRSTYFDCVEGSIDAFEIEFRIRTKKGGWKWILIRGKATSRDQEGRATRMVGTFVDISERKHMEEMLRMEHKLFELITSRSPIGIMFINRQGEIIFTNPRTEQILGLAKEQILRPPGNGHAGPETTAALTLLAEKERSVRKVLETGDQVLNHCFTLERPDGHRVHLSLNAAPFLDDAGQVGGTVATFEDVTERKLSEQMMADNAWLLAESQRIANLGSYVLDLADNSRKFSAKMEELLGIDKDYPRDLDHYLQIVHPDCRERYAESLTEAISSGRRLEIEYKIIRAADRQERWIAEYGEMQVDAAGNVRMIGTVQDVTDRKASEEAIKNLNDELDRRVEERTSQLDAAKQEMESFSYSVSHDLRAPLRHINSYSNLLIDEFSDDLPKEAKHYLERICAASSRMGILIDDLLMLTRVSRADMKHNSFNISKLAEDVAEMLKTSDPDRVVEFVIAGGLTAKGDSILVRLVLENLMQNAMKYSSKTASARIEFGRTLVKGKNAFFVKDNGVGFDMAYSDKLFQPFQRLHGGEFEGTGIGLATVKKIVQRHGGCVWAEGVENEGATFYFTLPDKSKVKYETGRPPLSSALES